MWTARLWIAEWIIVLGFKILPQPLRRIHAAALLADKLRAADSAEQDEWLQEVRVVLSGDGAPPH